MTTPHRFKATVVRILARTAQTCTPHRVKRRRFQVTYEDGAKFVAEVDNPAILARIYANSTVADIAPEGEPGVTGHRIHRL